MDFFWLVFSKSLYFSLPYALFSVPIKFSFSYLQGTANRSGCYYIFYLSQVGKLHDLKQSKAKGYLTFLSYLVAGIHCICF